MPSHENGHASRKQSAGRSIAAAVLTEGLLYVHNFAHDYRIRPLRILYTPCGPDVFYLCLMAPARDAEAGAAGGDRGGVGLGDALHRIGPAGRHDNYTTTIMPNWWTGRVAVIGDAAHAMPSALGQGAGVSMLNAVEMAEAVPASATLEAGLATWEAALRPVVEQWQREVEGLADQRTLDELESEDRIAFRYVDSPNGALNSVNPNGSLRDIAGILNKERNVMGMMPHPERACDPLMGSAQGLGIFESMLGYSVFSAVPALTK